MIKNYEMKINNQKNLCQNIIIKIDQQKFKASHSKNTIKIIYKNYKN